MFEAEDIRDWRNHDVIDHDGSKIGSLEGIYFVTATQQPAFASVQIGILGRHKLTFVPLDGASVSPHHIRILADKKTVKDAPSIDTDGELTAEEEPGLYAHYGLPYHPGATGERRLGRH